MAANLDKDRTLEIEDIELSEQPSTYAQVPANKLLAKWLIEHWMAKRKIRKTLIFKKRALFYGAKLTRGVR